MVKAIVIINGKVKGTIILKDTKKGIKFSCDLKNISEGYHGFHIHEFGDISDKANSLGGHYNPENKNHGGLNSINRHKGDLGNLIANKNNIVKYNFYVKNLNVSELLGRSLVIHEKKDDLGKGSNKESKKTGNSGKRIGYGIIGLMKN